MSCQCNKKTIVFNNQKIEVFDRKTAPFDSCLNCVIKHLSLALILYHEGETDRGKINVFLAYKHLEKRFAEMAKTTFELYANLLNGKADCQDVKAFVKFYFQKRGGLLQSKDETSLNLEKTLDKQQLKYTYLWAAYELLFHQFGYDEINKAYASGYLQLANELQQDEIKKQFIRALWIEPQQQAFEKLLKN